MNRYIGFAIIFIISIIMFFLMSWGYGSENTGNRRKPNKTKNTLDKKILNNKYVILTYIPKEKRILCTNVLDIKKSALVEWKKQPDYIQGTLGEDVFESIYKKVSAEFKSTLRYSDVVQILKQNYKNVEENKQEFKSTHLTNINEASESELSKFPGINIAMAKKIIQRINSVGDFSSIEQMCEEMKVKRRFRGQLEVYLCAKPVKLEKKPNDIINNNNINDNNNDDRIIDF